MVCMASRSGRSSLSNLSLRAAQTPKGIPINAAATTELPISTSVAIVLFQSPMQPMYRRLIKENDARVGPDIRNARRKMAMITAVHGIHSSIASSFLRTASTPSPSGLRMNAKVALTQSAKSSISSRRE